MVNRRTFIFGTAGIALTSLLASCSQAIKGALKVTVLQGSIPAEVLQRYQKQSETPVSFQLAEQIKTIFQQLQRWQQPPESEGFSWGRLLPWQQTEKTPTPNNLVSLGDYWLAGAIAKNLIAPLELPEESLEKLPLPWQQFVTRDAEGQLTTGQLATGQPAQSLLWAAPYQVQTLVIVYRQSFFPDASPENPPFTSWRDLLQPQLRQQLALPDHPRLVIGLLQKMQDGSFNLPIDTVTTTKKLEQQLAAPFNELNKQVKTYDATHSLKALVNKDVKAVVAWSGEVVSALRRYQDLRVTVPAEGSLLSADLWVRPQGAEMTEAAKQWVDFCWQSGPATQMSISGRGISPVFLKTDADVPELLNDSLLPLAAIRNSEPLLPIPEKLQAAYWELWQTLRTG
ncbi:MAG: extracellular solute-binding protein [Phormidesmis sp.]